MRSQAAKTGPFWPSALRSSHDLISEYYLYLWRFSTFSNEGESETERNRQGKRESERESAQANQSDTERDGARDTQRVRESEAKQ